MGSRSKAAIMVKGVVQRGAFGQKQHAEVVGTDGKTYIVGVERPNHGSHRLRRNFRLRRKGHRHMRLGDMKQKAEFSDTSASAKKGPSLAKKLFQRKEGQ